MKMEVYAGIPSDEGHLDGARQDSKFDCPETILEGPLGHLVVAERGGPWLRVIDNRWVSTQELFGRLEGRDLALEPCGNVFVTPGGELYVNSEGRMWRAQWEATAQRLLCKPGPKVQFTCFVVCGDAMVGATPGMPRIGPQLLKVTWSGVQSVIADLNGGAGGIVVTRDGHFHVTQRERVLRVSITGQVDQLVPLNLPPPQLGDRWFSDSMRGMSMDGEDTLYISDTYGHVFSMSPTGRVDIAVNLPSGTTDVLVSSEGHLYVPDYHNHVILRSVDRVAPPRRGPTDVGGN